MKLSNAVRRPPRWVLVLAGVVIVAAVAVPVWNRVSTLGATTIAAEFPATTALYPGDEVRVLGVRVGRIDAIEPGVDRVRVAMTIDRGVDIPADARAVIVAPSLVAARFIQLAPAYTGGPRMRDGATIGLDRTAIPVEWDDIKAELAKLSTALGPVGQDSQGSFARFVDTVSDNLDGNGERLRETIRALSATLTTVSDGRADLFGTIRNLQQFVEVLSSSNEQIVQFGGRLASVSSVLAGVRSDLGAGLDNLDSAITDVQRFLDSSDTQLTEGVQRLAQVTQIVADNRTALERVLHAAPTGLANFYTIYKPAQGSLAGAVVLNNTANPFAFLCGSVQAVQTANSDRSADLCRQYLAPVVDSLAMNYLPIMTNPASGVQALPSQLEFSPPSLADRVPAAPVTASGIPDGLVGLAVPGGVR
ncbi:MCE family protein [Nocardia bovistercoris]|uniref:MCE family protein n=1 Tax=Nocardia bovistercoris TaxID=2785916 RepID=A0A931I871_9NOCA|nr:MCE family protein [Nocardia bovistercoris]MBH0776639.1 MCE family protein [Nocardia bovistercoris]